MNSPHWVIHRRENGCDLAGYAPQLLRGARGRAYEVQTDGTTYTGSAGITAAVFGSVTVTVLDSDGTAQAGLAVYAFDGSTYKNFTAVTDTSGQVTFNLPEGSYRFRTDLHGAQYFSAEANDCTVTTCTSATVSVPVYGEVTVTAQSSAGKVQTGLSVYAFDGSTYTGISGATGEDGKVGLWLPEGSYRFRADQFELQFFSDSENHCSVPECTAATVSTLGMQEDTIEQTITYSYDDLNRLTRASYDDGSYYDYTYDAAGNRLTETTEEGSTGYTYDAANRLTAVNGQAYEWDDNGNLLSDGAKTYTYEIANHLTGVSSSSYTYQYVYNGLGDRVKSVLDGVTTTYALDLNSGLTQVLADGSNTYLYGLSRISQTNEETTGYFLGDGLGSVRQARTLRP